MFLDDSGAFMSDIYDERVELFAVEDPDDMPVDTQGNFIHFGRSQVLLT
jgi:hypothetical protein